MEQDPQEEPAADGSPQAHPGRGEDQGAAQELKIGLKIGLTGGIGSGKSTVARMLVDLGAVLVDTDAIARELTAPGGAAIPALREAFGPQAVGADGALNRDWMRERVFSDPEAKGRLEAILHPMIGETARQHRAAGHARAAQRGGGRHHPQRRAGPARASGGGRPGLAALA
jgi:hypothetical protein